jgi:homoserine O-acetyltransferase
VIGGSFGGMQTLEYALQGNQIAKPASVQENTPSSSDTPYIKSIIPIACNAQHSAWQIAISEIQRQMIYQDVQWSTHQQYHLATNGLQLARQMAMISYRTAMGYSNKFSRRTASPTTTTTTSEGGSSSNDKLMNNTATTAPPVTTVPQWEVSNYLKYQGEKFIRQRQFDPITYVKLTQQMDTHDICRNRIEEDHTATAANTTKSDEEKVASILQQITIPTLILGIDSDILYPIKEQELLAKYIPNSQFYTIHSIEGHDGFLIEQQQVGTYIQNFLSSL